MGLCPTPTLGTPIVPFAFVHLCLGFTRLGWRELGAPVGLEPSLRPSKGFTSGLVVEALSIFGLVGAVSGPVALFATIVANVLSQVSGAVCASLEGIRSGCVHIAIILVQCLRVAGMCCCWPVLVIELGSVCLLCLGEQGPYIQFVVHELLIGFPIAFIPYF